MDLYRLVFDKKAWMKEYNARPEIKEQVRAASMNYYWANKDTPEFKAKKSERDRKYRITHAEEKRERDRLYHLRNRDKHLQIFRNRITFQNKQIQLDFNPRTGKCSQCGSVGRTDLHHIKYDPANPLANTIELCIPCHRKTRIGMKYNKVKSGGGCTV